MAPMTSADRQKRYREKLKANNPEKHEAKRKAHLEKVKSNKKKISELSQNEQKKRREKWREYSAKHYNKQKGIIVTTSEEEQKFKKMQKKWRQNVRQMKEKVTKLTAALQIQIKSNRNMKRQIERMKKKVKTIPQDESTTQCCLLIDTCKHKVQSEVVDPPTPVNTDLFNASPMKKTEIFVDTLSSVSEADKTKLKDKILELNVLSESLKENYKSATKSEKQIFKKVAKNPITEKYKIVTNLAKRTLGLTGRIRKSGKILLKKRAALIKEIHDFYNRDDVTRCTAGKKETKTKNKNKVQRKYLLDSIKELYKKYKESGGKASYTSLLRHRPFYVLNPKLDDCESCACIKHANFTFKILKLHKVGVIKTKSINEILTEISCDLKSKACMYGDCNMCSTKTYKIETELDAVETVNVGWFQWRLKKVEYQKNKNGNVENCVTKKYKKEVVESSLQELISKFQEEAMLFKKHFFNINHQQKIFKESKEKLKDDEAVLICDFSENYNCKYSTEIQGMHFGSSRNQITLHTGVVYVKNQKPISFCTLSPSNEHNPHSIWAHLLPVLNALKDQNPKIKTIHFFSDGPSTQYKQKYNFLLFSKFTKQLGLSNCTWNFFESAHGKNAADGIGGAVKRNLDRHVAYGSDIPDAETAFGTLKKTSKIMLHYVTESDIQAVKEFSANDDVKPLKGTMSVHQIITTEDESRIKYRDISCLCDENMRGCCTCFNIKDHILISVKDSIKTSNNITEMEQVKEKRKFSILSDIKVTAHNIKNIRTQKLHLKKIYPRTDISFPGPSTSQEKENHGFSSSVAVEEDFKTKRLTILKIAEKNIKSQIQNKNKRRSNIRAAKVNDKKAKRRRRSSSATTTSESGDISLHSDSDLEDALSDDEETIANKKTEISSKTTIKDNTFKLTDNNTDEAQQITDDNKVNANQIYVTQKKLQKIYKKKDEKMKFDDVEQEIQICNIIQYDESQNNKLKGDSNNVEKNIEGKEVMDIEGIKSIDMCNLTGYKKPHAVGEAEDCFKNNDSKEKMLEGIEKTKSELQDIDETEKHIYCSGNTVLVRYYIKKAWKYYVGVIETINDADKLYTISFYTTIGARDKLKFRKPFRLDKDIVPETLIVKRIEILQISDKPEEYVLFCDEDLVYFKK